MKDKLLSLVPTNPYVMTAVGATVALFVAATMLKNPGWPVEQVDEDKQLTKWDYQMWGATAIAVASAAAEPAAAQQKP